MSDVLKKRIFQVLSQSVPVADLVGERIFSSKPSPGIAFPMVAFEVPGSVRVGSLDNGNSGGLEDASVNIQCYAQDDLVASELARTVIDAIAGTDQFYAHEIDSSEDYDQFDKSYSVEITATIMNYVDGR